MQRGERDIAVRAVLRLRSIEQLAAERAGKELAHGVRLTVAAEAARNVRVVAKLSSETLSIVALYRVSVRVSAGRRFCDANAALERGRFAGI